MTKKSSAFVYVGVVVATILAVEIACFAYLLVADLRNGISWSAAFNNRARENPFFSRAPSYCSFDPLQRTFCERGVAFNGLAIGEYGFFGNGPEGVPLDGFPAKPPGVYRILLYGGSSAAGMGLTRNSDTISANLERMLNHERRAGAQAFQVLNLAFSGGNSYNEISQLFAAGIHYSPDMLIFLDGWNDGILTFFEYERQGLPHPMLAWDERSYALFNQANNLDAQNVRAPYILTYAFLAIRRWTRNSDRQSADRLAVYNNHPFFEVSRRILDINVHNAAFLQKANLNAAASYARTNGVAFLGYLQPWPGDGVKLSPAADAVQEAQHQAYQGIYGSRWSRKEFTERMQRQFASAAKAYTELNETFTGTPSVKFMDVRTLFSDSSVDLYLDIIHYNNVGTRIIAERMARDVRAAMGTGRQ